MSIIQIIVLSAICAAFVIFAVVLAWGDYQTRNISHQRAARSKAPSSSGSRPVPANRAPHASVVPAK